MTKLVPALRTIAEATGGQGGAGGGTGMYGASILEMAFVDQWVEYITGTLQKTAESLIYSILGYLSISKTEFEFLLNKKLMCELTRVENRLKETNGQFLVESFTIADSVLFGTCLNLFRFCLNGSARARLPHLSAFMAKTGDLEAFSSAFGKVFLCKNTLRP